MIAEMLVETSADIVPEPALAGPPFGTPGVAFFAALSRSPTAFAIRSGLADPLAVVDGEILPHSDIDLTHSNLQLGSVYG
jgi:hypothetical protein